MDVPLPDHLVSAMLFGKLPSHGDFVWRGLEAEAKDVLDAWLSEEMVAARAAFAGEFESLYDRAPAWRFAVEDEGGWIAGALAPSADSAGRRFPILVARVAERAEEAARLAATCEAAVYEGFAQRWGADQLHGRLAAMAVEPGDESEPRSGSGWWTLGNSDFPENSLPGDRPQGLIAAMLGKASGEA